MGLTISERELIDMDKLTVKCGIWGSGTYAIECDIYRRGARDFIAVSTEDKAADGGYLYGMGCQTRTAVADLMDVIDSYY